jgi:hypothetical protein
MSDKTAGLEPGGNRQVARRPHNLRKYGVFKETNNL